MLRTAEAELILPEGTVLNQSMGSVMHGALMEQVDRDWAEQMHGAGIRPYSQCLAMKNQIPVWRISSLNEEAWERLLGPALSVKSLRLTQRGFSVALRDFHVVREESFEELEKRYWTSQKKYHHIDIQFLTSTSFRSGGQYMIFPDSHLMLHHWIEKWNAFSDTSVLKEDRLAENLAGTVQITGYRLHMHPYSVEGRRIRAFRGQVKLGLFANETAARMICMLADFASFSGTGIKTALGMGGTQTQIALWEGDRE
jgi:CRISPR-associated endoribonuclease Cas6